MAGLGHESGDELGDPIPEASSLEVWNKLNKHGAVLDGVNLDDYYLHADDCVVCMEEMTDEAIAQDMLGVMDSCNDDREAEYQMAARIPSANEVLDTLDILSAYANAQEGDDALEAFWTLVRLVMPNLSKKHQTKVIKYFGPQE